MEREIIFLSGLGVNVMVSSMLRIGLKVFLAMAETRTFSVHDDLEVSVLIVMMVVPPLMTRFLLVLAPSQRMVQLEELAHLPL